MAINNYGRQKKKLKRWVGIERFLGDRVEFSSSMDRLCGFRDLLSCMLRLDKSVWGKVIRQWEKETILSRFKLSHN